VNREEEIILAALAQAGDPQATAALRAAGKSAAEALGPLADALYALLAPALEMVKWMEEVAKEVAEAVAAVSVPPRPLRRRKGRCRARRPQGSRRVSFSNRGPRKRPREPPDWARRHFEEVDRTFFTYRL
jgi:hypothetical protein